jgi:hypothetical protein
VSLLLIAAVVRADALEQLRDKSSGRMFAIRVTPAAAPAARAGVPEPAELRATADAFIDENRELIGLADPSRDLVATPARTDALGLSRVRYLQTYRGLDVLGGEVAVHVNRDGQVTYVKTKVARELPAETAPRVAEAAAVDAALGEAVSQGMSMESLQVWRSRLLILPLGMIRNEASEQTHLAWERWRSWTPEPAARSSRRRTTSTRQTTRSCCRFRAT